MTQGFAGIFRRYSDDPELLELEAQANQKWLGQWSDPNPIPPWEWRSGRRQFSHSSFNAGKNVIAAGFIVANNGTLIRISNNSGHYKTTRQQLFNAVQLLSQDLALGVGGGAGAATAEYWDFETEPGFINIYEYPFGAFFADGNLLQNFHIHRMPVPP